jgi:hypothetical protein
VALNKLLIETPQTPPKAGIQIINIRAPMDVDQQEERRAIRTVHAAEEAIKLLRQRALHNTFTGHLFSDNELEFFEQEKEKPDQEIGMWSPKVVCLDVYKQNWFRIIDINKN